MLTVKKVRLEQRSAKLVGFDLASGSTWGRRSSLVNEREIVRLTEDYQEQVSVTADQICKYTDWLRGKFWESVLSNNCNLLLKVLLLQQFLSSPFYLRDFSKDLSLQKLWSSPHSMPIGIYKHFDTGFWWQLSGQYWLLLKNVVLLLYIVIYVFICSI